MLERLKAVLKTKTFWTAIGGIVTVAGCAATGVMVDGHVVNWADVAKTAWAAMIAIFIRNGVEKNGPIPPATMIMVCILGMGTFSGCSTKGKVRVGLFPTPNATLTTDKAEAQISMETDSDPDALAAKLTYRSKTTQTPDIGMTLDRPSTDTLVCRVRGKLTNATPAPQKVYTVDK